MDRHIFFNEIEFLKEYREIFSFFDRDGGGTITSVELGQVMRTFGWNPSEGDLQARCYYFDLIYKDNFNS